MVYRTDVPVLCALSHSVYGMPCAYKELEEVRSVDVTLIVFVGSLLLYVLPCLSDANKFYLLPARLFEFAAGGLIAVIYDNNKETVVRNRSAWYGVLIGSLVLLILLSINCNLDAKQYRLLIAVGFTTLLVVMSTKRSEEIPNLNIPAITTLGMASYSLYLWHQPILAFYRYVVNDQFTVWSYLIVLSASFVIGFILLLYRATYFQTCCNKKIKSPSAIRLFSFSIRTHHHLSILL
jgi:peptidoglycan/LPS O-acetylase OafA/YrhL